MVLTDRTAMLLALKKLCSISFFYVIFQHSRTVRVSDSELATVSPKLLYILFFYCAFCSLSHDTCILCWLQTFFTHPWDKLCFFPHSGLSISYTDFWPPTLFEPPPTGFVFMLPDEIAAQYDVVAIWCTFKCHKKINTAELSLSSALPWLYYCWWYLDMCLYTLAHLLLLAPILTCTLISASLIPALVKAWVFCTLTLKLI